MKTRMEIWLGMKSKAELIQIALELNRERNMYRDTVDKIPEEEE